MGRVLERVAAGEDDPPCRTCGGILKSATISFGQSLVPDVIDRAMTVADEAEVLLAIGTSLQVYPVANMVPLAKAARVKTHILASRSARPVSMVRERSMGPVTAMQLCPAASP